MMPAATADTTIHLTPAQAWQAWQTILGRLYSRGYSQEQLAEWTGMDPNHALIRHYQNLIYLQPPSRAWRHCKTPPWLPGACNLRVTSALEALLDLPPPLEHVSKTSKMVLYNIVRSGDHDVEREKRDEY